jgi:hypothetical protein
MRQPRTERARSAFGDFAVWETVGVMEYIILIVVLAVLIVGIGGTMLLRPGRGLRRGRSGGEVTGGGGTGTITEGGTRPAGGETESGVGTVTLPPGG